MTHHEGERADREILACALAASAENRLCIEQNIKPSEQRDCQSVSLEQGSKDGLQKPRAGQIAVKESFGDRF